MKKFQVALSLLTLAGAISAQCATVQFLGASNGQKGVMFAIDNTTANPITITGIDSRFLAAGTATIEIYSAVGSFVGNESNALFWGAPVLTIPGFVHPGGTITPTPITSALALVVAPGARQSIWLTCTAATASNIYYTTGVGQYNATIASNAGVNLIGGVGKTYPLPGTTFGLPTAGRIFNGTVTYKTGVLNSYDTNTVGASLDVNGLQGGPCAAANTVLCAGTPTTVTLNSNVAGAPFEMAYNLAAIVPIGGGATVVGTVGILNLDLGAGLFFLNGGLAPILNPHPGVPIPLLFGMPVLPAPGISAQMLVVSGAAPDGFELSQPINIQGTALSTTTAGPVGDDVALSFTAGTTPPPGCFSAPTIALYGTSYTRYHVITNGRVVMGPTANTSFSPAATYAATEAPFAGIHCDFNTLVAGTITVSNVAGDLQVDYTGIGYFAQPGTASTLSLLLSSSSNVTISNTAGTMLGLPTAVGTDAFAGVHPGGAVTIDPAYPLSYVGTGSATGAAGFSHGRYSADLIATPLTDPIESLTFTFVAGAYDVSY